MIKNTDLSALGLPPLPSHSSEVISTMLWAREVLQKHLGSTYSINDPKGIEELKPVNICGIDQWLHIRGRNRTNPILLYLHGGPGFPMIGWRDGTFLAWEDFFTVVHWDQRQTGKSYYPDKDEVDPLTVEQFIKDTEEVIQYLQGYLGQDKLFVLGHSWGSVLGMHMVERHPDWLHAYIGIGQVVNMMDGERILYERLVSYAREFHKMELISELEALAPYPNPSCPQKSFSDHSSFLRMELSRLAGEAGCHHLTLQESIEQNALNRVLTPYLTLTDISNALLGDKPAVFRPPYALGKEFMAIDLPKNLGSSFEVPIFFFSGRHDYQTPVTLSDAWFNQIKAPHKELIHFEESAHIVVSEEPGKVLVNLVNQVLPFAQAPSDLPADHKSA